MQGYWQLSLRFSPEGHKPRTLLMPLWSPLPSLPQSPRWVAASEVLCIGPLWGVLVSLVDSRLSLADRSLVAFHSPKVVWAPFPSSGALGWGTQLGVWTPCCSGVSMTGMSLKSLSHCLWEWGCPDIFVSLPFLLVWEWLLL